MAIYLLLDNELIPDLKSRQVYSMLQAKNVLKEFFEVMGYSISKKTRKIQKKVGEQVRDIAQETTRNSSKKEDDK